MKELIVASKNKGKVAEIAAALAGQAVLVRSLADYPDAPDVEETGSTFAENALIKARAYRDYTGCACLADDSGLEVDGLDGAPGVYSARFAGEGASDAENNRKLLSMLQGMTAAGRQARFRCALVFIDADGSVIETDGTCEGMIAEAPRGTGGFGYDPLFLLPGGCRTMAELRPAEKNAISHRGKAVQAMVVKLKEYLG